MEVAGIKKTQGLNYRNVLYAKKLIVTLNILLPLTEMHYQKAP